MALLVEKIASDREYNVKDMSFADFGRLQIKLAEVEMPGLMSCQTEFGPTHHSDLSFDRNPNPMTKPHVRLDKDGTRLDPGSGLDVIVDDDGDGTLLFHGEVKAEYKFSKSRKLPDLSSTNNSDFQIVLTIIHDDSALKTILLTFNYWRW